MAESLKGRIYTPGKPLSGDLLMTIISHLKQEGANEETGEIPRGVKTRVSDMLKIDLHCVTRAWSKWLTDKNAVLKGNLKPNCGRKKILETDDVRYIEFLKKESPSTSLQTIQEKLVTNSNKTVSIQTISRAIRNDLDFTYKRLTKPAAERFTFDNLRYTEVFMHYLHQQVASRIKFFDESGFNTRDSTPVYGHSERGLPAVEVHRYSKSSNLTLNLLIGMHGVMHCNVIEGATDIPQYLSFFGDAIGAYTEDGLNALSPGDIVVVDNAPVHRNQGGNALARFLDYYGIEYIFTPTYSPDLNPVERVFSKIKSVISRPEFSDLVHENLAYAIYCAVGYITSADCVGYYRLAGYMNT